MQNLALTSSKIANLSYNLLSSFEFFLEESFLVESFLVESFLIIFNLEESKARLLLEL